ncbi:hypothetical protein L1987_50720 [Smallanthus sonchifolius]|uniref:Uncharacterized protein n=1 Tax=Smallanthus sonchifolius TaxID=185202 RepID=A0ACB9ENR8_9ASTR|nr:hypothetical protein L1987_50720 [Smallanthus sonchifolius]
MYGKATVGRRYFHGFTTLLPPLTLRPVAGRFQIARASTFSSTQMEAEPYKFGPYTIHQKESFYSTDLSYAFVNLRPVLPGHILEQHELGLVLHNCIIMNRNIIWIILLKREVKRFVDLTAEETTDLWISAQKIGKQLENYHNASSLTFTIQDGPQAGQTVPHVHIHILPRKDRDFENNDEIYDAIDEKEKEVKKLLDLDKERKDRSMEERAREAAEYRKLFF